MTQAAFKPDWTNQARPSKRNAAMPDVPPVGVPVFPGNGILENVADTAKKLGIPVLKLEMRREAPLFSSPTALGNQEIDMECIPARVAKKNAGTAGVLIRSFPGTVRPPRPSYRALQSRVPRKTTSARLWNN